MTWMQTRSGTPFELLNPQAHLVDFEDVAHALGNLCRFAGHTRTFYSVAEHCVRVADMLPDQIKLYGLLHDAHEAFTGDITTPVQLALGIQGGSARLKIMQRLIDVALWEAAGLSVPHRAVLDAVKYADLAMLATERRDLLHAGQRSWGEYEQIAPLSGRIIVPLTPHEAAAEWLTQLNRWRGG